MIQIEKEFGSLIKDESHAANQNDNDGLWFTIFQQMHGTKKSFSNFKNLLRRAS
jgi:hypothetical protein